MTEMLPYKGTPNDRIDDFKDEHAPPAASPDRPASPWTALLPLIVASAGAVLVLALPLQRLIPFFVDDSFFYLKTASNIGAGLGSTFDGVNLSNGYHPLYMALLVGISRIIPIHGETGVRTVAFLDVVLAGAGLNAMEATLRRLQVRTIPRAVALVTTFAAIGINDFGIEVRLLFPLAWSLMYAVSTHGPGAGARHTAIIAILSVLVCLTRLDAFLLAALMCLLAACQSGPGWRQRLSSFVALFGPSAVAVSVYAMVNYLLFSHPETISSWLKAGLHHRQGLSVFKNIGLKSRAAFCGAASAGFIAWALREAGRRRLDRANATLFAACVFVIIFLSSIIAFSRGGIMDWYFALPLSIAIAVCACVWSRFTASWCWGRYRMTARIAMVVIALAAGGAFIRWKFRYVPMPEFALACWMDQNLPPDARVYQVDFCGTTGYFSNRSVINGDGLINSWKYQGILRYGTLPQYLADCRVRYLVWTGYGGESPIQIPLPLWDTADRWITFVKSPQQIAREQQFVLLRVDPADIIVRDTPLPEH